MAIITSQTLISGPTTFTPTVTLVGGAGNTVPVYSTNQGRYTLAGKDCRVSGDLTGDGGAEGAGTGRMTIALPFTASSSTLPNEFYAGTAWNGATFYLLLGVIQASGTTVSLYYMNAINTRADFTGADQNNTSRVVHLDFSMETA